MNAVLLLVFTLGCAVKARLKFFTEKSFTEQSKGTSYSMNLRNKKEKNNRYGLLKRNDSYNNNMGSLPDNVPNVLVKPERTELSVFARAYVNQTDALFNMADSIKPLNGFEDFVIHGEPDLVEYEIDDGQWITLTPIEFAEALKNDKEYHGGNIRLISCKSGMSDDGFAQQLADLLGVNVMAPTEIVWVSDDGEMFVTNSETLARKWCNGDNVTQTGEWRIFKPQKGEIDDE